MTPPHGEQQPHGDQGQPYGGDPSQPYGDHGQQHGDQGWQQQYGQQQPYGQPYPPPPGYGQPYGAPGYGVAPGPPPENHLVWGILTTVLCCLPLGIVSIVKSSQVNTLWAQGQYDQARQSADEAKKWAMWSAIVQVSLFVLIAIFYVVLFAVFAVNVETN